MFSIRLVIYSLLFMLLAHLIAMAQKATDSLVIQNDGNKSTVTIVKKKAHNPIRPPIIFIFTKIVLTII